MRRVLLWTTLFAVLVGSSASAHHAVGPNFNLDEELELAGATLTEFRFVNPHVYLYLEVPTVDGNASWRCEMAAASRLKRRGWTAETLMPGQTMTIDGSPAWREQNVCHVTTITLSDGATLSEFAGRPSAEEVSGALVAAGSATQRPRYLENGQPNFKGPWVSTQPSLNMPEIESTEAGARAGTGLVRHFDSPALRCETMNIVADWIFERESNDVYQSDDTVRLQYGYLDLVRTIYLDQPEHPANLEPSVTGHSIGRWEGDVLIVDTVGFAPGILEHTGGEGFAMHSDQWHVVERFELSDDGLTLTRSYSFEDPLFMEGTYSGQDWHSLTNDPYVPYACEELSGVNNQRPAE